MVSLLLFAQVVFRVTVNNLTVRKVSQVEVYDEIDWQTFYAYTIASVLNSMQFRTNAARLRRFASLT